ncbi:ABC transporter substrate-binding protein [Leeia sp. TBRC 13508]|uniref:ABC transporter substrate-binding protein n=1 Tax=Leeia speluncae TaxID=2884804 RepID=A0ABS8D6X1_9NEIS|nr:ABC transporter substrate-binding protein [Leeia speluncae]MCB6183921.1 ABC transporter substrate-binding protein [Leeia speluncae]
MRGLKTPATLPRLDRRSLLQYGGAISCLTLLQPLTEALAAGARLPSRVVSIGGALTEMVYALGAAPQLAGVDTTSLFPQAATKLPSVGYARALSVEGILSLAPDLILATEDAGPPDVIRKLQSAKVNVAILPANHQFEGMLTRFQAVGKLLGKEALANKQIQQLKADWAAARTQITTGTRSKKKVLFVLSHGPSQIMVGGKETSADAMLDYVGMDNAMGNVSGYKPMTTEAVIAAQPDIVLFTSQGLSAIGGVNGALKLPGIAQTPAGKSQRIVSQEAMLMLGFGPRMPQALQALDQVLQQSLKA